MKALRRLTSASSPRLSAVVLVTLMLLGVAHPIEAHRLALVIGNDSYQHAEPLRNARADSKAVASALQSNGFAVTLKQDVGLSAMKEALRTFKAQVSGGDEVVFYFSGHGVQFGGSNYLIPVDLTPQNEEQVADDSVALQRVLDDLRDQKARFTLAIIDACRNNPFKGTGRAIGGRGLAPVTAATGQMVLYSAGAGQEALDRLGAGDTDPNGLFTRVFIKEVRKPGVPADQILKNVRDQVVRLAKSVNHEQVPALYDQTIGEFYFVPRAAGATATGAAEAVRVQSAGELEQSFWDRIKDSSDPQDFADYAKSFPNGSHSAEAALLSRKLKRQAATAGGAAATPAVATATPPTTAPAAPVVAKDTRPRAPANPFRPDGCDGVIGAWNWSITGTVEFSPEHQMHWTPPPGSNAPPVTGTWSCTSAAERRIELRWPTGFVDTLTLSNDGRTLSGRSSAGIPVMGARAGR
jgi:hypothetical protein